MGIRFKNIEQAETKEELNSLLDEVDAEWFGAKRQWDMANDLHDNLQRKIKARKIEVTNSLSNINCKGES